MKTLSRGRDRQGNRLFRTRPVRKDFIDAFVKEDSLEPAGLTRRDVQRTDGHP